MKVLLSEKSFTSLKTIIFVNLYAYFFPLFYLVPCSLEMTMNSWLYSEILVLNPIFLLILSQTTGLSFFGK